MEQLLESRGGTKSKSKADSWCENRALGMTKREKQTKRSFHMPGKPHVSKMTNLKIVHRKLRGYSSTPLKPHPSRGRAEFFLKHHLAAILFTWRFWHLCGKWTNARSLRFARAGAGKPSG